VIFTLLGKSNSRCWPKGDLRGWSVLRLARAEATVPQIATFPGNGLNDVGAILDAHYLGCDIQLAEAAVLKLERRTRL
jgi:hypothetical protein